MILSPQVLERREEERVLKASLSMSLPGALILPSRENMMTPQPFVSSPVNRVKVQMNPIQEVMEKMDLILLSPTMKSAS
jgi:hypothetical protein